MPHILPACKEGRVIDIFGPLLRKSSSYLRRRGGRNRTIGSRCGRQLCLSSRSNCAAPPSRRPLFGTFTTTEPPMIEEMLDEPPVLTTGLPGGGFFFLAFRRHGA